MFYSKNDDLKYDDFKKALIDAAIREEQREFILSRSSVEEKLNVNFKNNKCVPGGTDLMFAAKHAPSVVKDIIENHSEIDVNAQDSDGHTALMYAASYANLIAVKAILSSGKAKLDCVDENGCTALMWAIDGGNLEIFKEILDFSIKDTEKDHYLKIVNAKDKNGCTILMYISEYLNSEMLKILWDTSCEKDAHHEILYEKDNNGFTALCYLDEKKNDLEMPEELLNILLTAAKSDEINDVDAVASLLTLAEKNNYEDKELANTHTKQRSLLFSHANQKKYAANINCLILALQQAYSPDSSTYIDVIRDSGLNKNLKHLQLNDKQLEEIELLIEQRYAKYFSSGGMCKSREMIDLAKKDKEKLRNALNQTLTHSPENRTKKPTKKRRSYSKDYSSDDSGNDSDFHIGSKKKKSDSIRCCNPANSRYKVF